MSEMVYNTVFAKMKKISLLVLLVVSVWMGFAQAVFNKQAAVNELVRNSETQNYVSTRATTPLLQEGFEAGLPAGWQLLDADGDGYNWVDALTLVASHESITEAAVAAFIHAGSNSLIAWSYYPTSFSTQGWSGIPLNSTDYLITPQVQLPATGTATLSYFMRNINTLYPDEVEVKLSTTGTGLADFTTTLTPSFAPTDAWVEYTVSLEAFAGQSVYIAFVHTGNDDMGLCLDNLAITHTDDASIVATPTALSFTVNFGDACAAQSVLVDALNLTGDITATATADFAVSADGTAFSSTATLTRNGGTLYVKYVPTAAGSNTGSVTLASSGLTTTIALSGTATDCSGFEITEFPYEEGFEGGIIPPCWTLLDADGNGESWISTADYHLYQHPTEISPLAPHSGNYAVCSRSFDNISVVAMTANNYLVTPAIRVPQNATLSFFVQAFGGSWDKYKVLVSTSGSTLSDFTQTLIPLTTAARNWEEVSADLGSFAGQTIYLAFVHEHRNGFWLAIDDVTIDGDVAVGENAMNRVSVYPNPARDVITIAHAEGENILILNAMGQVVSAISNAAAQQEVNISSLPAGTYFVKVKGVVEKVVVAR